MKKIQVLVAFILMTSFWACDNKEPQGLTDLQNESMLALTSGTTKTWRISQATLTNANGVIDLSENFNIVDDEFIFSGTGQDGTLKWNKGFDIQTNAATSLEALRDKYVSPISTSFSFQGTDHTSVVTDMDNLTFTVNSDNTINASITYPNNATLQLLLVEKTQDDYLRVTQSSLDFTTAFKIESSSILRHSPGMIGSYSANSIYIAVNEHGLGVPGILPERVFKIDLEDFSISERVFFKTDYFSKRLHLIDDELIVVGGMNVNTYDLDLSKEPETNLYRTFQTGLSRFGLTSLDEQLYIVGGGLSDVKNDKVLKWNMETNTVSEFATLPKPKGGADAAIVNDYLYVFGGTEVLAGPNSSDDIFKVNLNDPSQIETFHMGRLMNYTHIQQYQHLIFVAGSTEKENATGFKEKEATVGVFNTLDDTYEEISTNLTNPSGAHTIHQMCILNGKMYIIYGNVGTDTGGEFNEWEVLVSDLF